MAAAALELAGAVRGAVRGEGADGVGELGEGAAADGGAAEGPPDGVVGARVRADRGGRAGDGAAADGEEPQAADDGNGRERIRDEVGGGRAAGGEGAAVRGRADGDAPEALRGEDKGEVPLRVAVQRGGEGQVRQRAGELREGLPALRREPRPAAQVAQGGGEAADGEEREDAGREAAGVLCAADGGAEGDGEEEGPREVADGAGVEDQRPGRAEIAGDRAAVQGDRGGPAGKVGSETRGRLAVIRGADGQPGFRGRVPPLQGKIYGGGGSWHGAGCSGGTLQGGRNDQTVNRLG